MRSEIYQWALILALALIVILSSIFLYDELFPQYKIFQNAFVELEKFRSSYTGEPPSPFKEEVKQIVFFREDKGPETIDRCISCHVALSIPDYSATKIAYDVNGKVMVDGEGYPIKVPNENYVWKKLDEKIKSLTDEGKQSEAEKLKSLKSVEIEGRTIEMSKALSMHPLMGRETRPFEYHPMEQYGCTSCHNGNGRGLVIDKAHGPVYDGEYEAAHTGFEPHFTESDPKNDPSFSRIFNHKPGHDLLFQTTPLFVGNLIEAKCVQCHQPTNTLFQSVSHRVSSLSDQKKQQIQSIQSGIESDVKALSSLLSMKDGVNQAGYDQYLKNLKTKSEDLSLPSAERSEYESQVNFLKGFAQNQADLQKQIDQKITTLAGSKEAAPAIKGKSSEEIQKFYEEHPQYNNASIYQKMAELKVHQEILKNFEDAGESFEGSIKDQKSLGNMLTDIDALTKTYHYGESLFISQACYACHRISGLTRGGVGPELTQEGLSYPWFIKESLVWPQADLKTSTMPNMSLDHDELEALVTFLLAQRGKSNATSNYQYEVWVKNWESGRKMPWEKPLSPEKIHDLRNSMTIFATEGCASCHRLHGFESNVGFNIESDGKKPDFDTLYKEKEWFESLFPETISGSQIVKVIEKHAEEIDKRIVDNVRKDSILEEIDESHPQAIESLYSNFKYASRAKNYEYTQQNNLTKLDEWKARVRRVLMMYVQEYGLGRLIGPRINWSGVFRTDKWLMDHFFNHFSARQRKVEPFHDFIDLMFI